MVEVSFLPILASGIAAVIISFIWFHPKVFGTYWMRASGITPEAAERGKKRMPFMLVGGLLSAMLVAWVMNYVGIALGIYDWAGAVFDLALWIWIGFIAPILIGTVFWEGRPFRLFLVNAGYWLVVLVVMALILLFGSNIASGSYGTDTTETAATVDSAE